MIYASALNEFDFDAVKTAESLGVGVATVYKWMRDHQLKETQKYWQDQILPYERGLKIKDLRSQIFTVAAKKHVGHPYKAAKELDVAPMTFYRWSGQN